MHSIFNPQAAKFELITLKFIFARPIDRNLRTKQSSKDVFLAVGVKSDKTSVSVLDDSE